MSWYRDPVSGRWVNPAESDEDSRSGGYDPAGTSTAGMLPNGQPNSQWTWDPGTQSYRTNLNPLGSGGGNNIPLNTGYNNALGQAWAGVPVAQTAANTTRGVVSGQSIAGYEATLFRSGFLVKQPTADGGFTVYVPSLGRYLGRFSPQDPAGSDWDQFGTFRGTMQLPPEVLQAIGESPTLAATIAGNTNAFNQGQLANTAEGQRLQAAAAAATNATTAQGNAWQYEVNKTNSEITRNRDNMANAARMGELEQLKWFQQNQIQLEAKRDALAERIAAANMAANPANWVANSYFLRGDNAPAGAMGLGSPGSEAVFGARNGSPVGAPAVDSTRQSTGSGGVPSGIDYNSMPWLQAVRGERRLPTFGEVTGGTQGPLGTRLPQASQVNFSTYNRLLPSEREMFGGAIKATGQYLPDYEEMMRRSAPIGGARGAQRFG